VKGVKVDVMPWFSPEYYAFFWQGLAEEFGAENLRVTRKGFPDATDSAVADWRDSLFLRTMGRRIWISANDHQTVRPEAAAWADVMGAVNVADAKTARPLGPAFGVRTWGARESVRLAAEFLRWRKPPTVAYRALIATLYRQHTRLPIREYQPAPPAPSSAPAVYLGSWWGKHLEANVERVAFLRAARRTLGRVDGGLVSEMPLPADVADLSTRRVSQRTYIELIRRSLLVFNHPAVHGCLGWKLGEFLALGKAVITTPIDNALPAPLVHGEHWHVTTLDGLDDAIDRIARDDVYRRRLEIGGRRWWEQHGTPRAMIRRVLAE
jgi:hypothetical protein